MERAKERKEDTESIIPKPDKMGKPQKACISKEAGGETSFLNKALEGDNSSSSLMEEASMCKSSPCRDSQRTNHGHSDSSDRASRDAKSTDPSSKAVKCKHSELAKSTSLGSQSSKTARSRVSRPPLFFTIFTVSVLSLMAVSLVWAYLSYSSAMSAVEDRLLRLEQAQLDYSDRIEALVAKTVDARLKEVLDQVNV